MATLDNSGRPFWIMFTGFFQLILGGLFDENTQMGRNVKTVDQQGIKELVKSPCRAACYSIAGLVHTSGTFGTRPKSKD
jgi:hypothetical protein